MPNTRGNQTHSGTNNGPDDLVRLLRDERIIELRRDGMALRQIAAEEDVALSTVQAAIKRWMDERGPSAEQVEELRQFQGAQLDAYQAKLAPHLMRKLRNEAAKSSTKAPTTTAGRSKPPTSTSGASTSTSSSAEPSSTASTLSAGAAGAITREALAALFYAAGDEPIDVEAVRGSQRIHQPSSEQVPTLPDAVLLAVRVHQGERDDQDPQALNAAGLRIVRARLRSNAAYPTARQAQDGRTLGGRCETTDASRSPQAPSKTRST